MRTFDRTRVSLCAGFLSCSISLAGAAEAPNVMERPDSKQGPTLISVGIWLVDVNSIDSAQQSFSADVAVILQWKDPRLAHTGAGIAHYPFEKLWHPQVALVNETNSINARLGEFAEVEPDGLVTYRQRYVGSFTQPLRLRSFPFDRQTFRIYLVAVRYGPSEIKFVPNDKWVAAGLKQGGGIAPQITLPDWTIEQWTIEPRNYALGPGLESSGYVFEFIASRNVQHFILKVILPLVLIVIMSWAVFWIDPTHSNSQINIAVTSMLTLIAYRFAVDSQLPRLHYMTRLDAFILASTILVFFSLIEVLVTTVLDNNKQGARAKRIDRYCRVIFPALFILASIGIFIRPRD